MTGTRDHPQQPHPARHQHGAARPPRHTTPKRGRPGSNATQATLRRGSVPHQLILNHAHLRVALAEYQEDYNTARPHQCIGQRVPHRSPASPQLTGDRGVSDPPKAVLSGLINEYERAA